MGSIPVIFSIPKRKHPDGVLFFAEAGYGSRICLRGTHIPPMVKECKSSPDEAQKRLFEDCFFFVWLFYRYVFSVIQTNLMDFSFFGKSLLSDQQTPTLAVPTTYHTECTCTAPDASFPAAQS